MSADLLCFTMAYPKSPTASSQMNLRLQMTGYKGQKRTLKIRNRPQRVPHSESQYRFQPSLHSILKFETPSLLPSASGQNGILALGFREM
jgi:hypothetical protein